MMMWEYETVKLTKIRAVEDYMGSEITDKEILNRYGDDNWELVSVDSGVAYFKRSKGTSSRELKAA